MPLLIGSMWKPLALIALVGALVGYRALLVHQRDAARRQSVALEAELAGLSATNQAMKAAVEHQNAALTDLTARAAAATRAVAAARSGAQIEQQAAAQAAALSRTTVPDGCMGAIAWGDAQGPELGRW